MSASGPAHQLAPRPLSSARFLQRYCRCSWGSSSGSGQGHCHSLLLGLPAPSLCPSDPSSAAPSQPVLGAHAEHAPHGWGEPFRRTTRPPRWKHFPCSSATTPPPPPLRSTPEQPAGRSSLPGARALGDCLPGSLRLLHLSVSFSKPLAAQATSCQSFCTLMYGGAWHGEVPSEDTWDATEPCPRPGLLGRAGLRLASSPPLG